MAWGDGNWNTNSGSGSTWGGGGGPGNGYLRSLHEYVMQNAMAEQTGARNAAMRSAGDDPSKAAYGSLSGMLSGQSQASHQLAAGRLQWMKQQMEWAQRLKEMRQQAQLQKEAQGNPWLGALGSLGGSALGAWLSPGGIFKGVGG